MMSKGINKVENQQYVEIYNLIKNNQIAIKFSIEKILVVPKQNL